MSSPFYIGQPGESYIIELNRLHGVATAQKGTPDPWTAGATRHSGYPRKLP